MVCMGRVIASGNIGSLGLAKSLGLNLIFPSFITPYDTDCHDQNPVHDAYCMVVEPALFMCILRIDNMYVILNI